MALTSKMNIYILSLQRLVNIQTQESNCKKIVSGLGCTLTVPDFQEPKNGHGGRISNRFSREKKFQKKRHKWLTKIIEKTNSNNIKSPATNLDPYSYSKIFFFSFVRLKVTKYIHTCE